MAVSESVVGWSVLVAVTTVTAAVIVNGALGNYEDSKGHAYGAASNRATVSVAGVSADMVLPKEASLDPIADAATHGTVATRTFTVTNDSNISDAYSISALSVSGGSIKSVVFGPSTSAPINATVGVTVSPPVPVGGSLSVAVTVSTDGAAVGTGIEIQLTAKTTAASQNGPQSDTGEAWVLVAAGPEISGVMPGSAPPPRKAKLPPVVEFVNGAAVAQAEPGAAVAFELPITNLGDAPAFGVTIVDVVPALLHPVADSATLQSTLHRSAKSVTLTGDARIAMSGNTISVTIPRLEPGIDVVLTYGATVSSSARLGSAIPNRAQITAQSISEISAIPATVFIGAMDTVYDAIAGSAHPIAAAQVSLVDPAGGAKAALPATGTALNPANLNPFATSSSGAFGFALPHPAARELDYDLYVAASNYVNRRIKVALTAGADGLETTTLTALDGLPLAVAGGFDLTSAPVTVAGVTGFFGNVPMFAPQPIVLTIAADRSVASAGDRVAYSVDFGPGNKPLEFASELSIALPPGVAYAHGTARIGHASSDPAAAGRTLAWPLKDLAERRTLTFDAVVMPGVTERATLTTRAHLVVSLHGAPVSTEAGVDVAVVGGALSARGIVSGRVYSDHGHDGRFAPGDVGLAGVRIFLEDGESILTDHDGRFSFPAARPGMHVLHLDPITLPAGMHTYHGFPVNDPRSSIRLVHGIFDAGLMDDVSFAISEGPGR